MSLSHLRRLGPGRVVGTGRQSVYRRVTDRNVVMSRPVGLALERLTLGG